MDFSSMTLCCFPIVAWPGRSVSQVWRQVQLCRDGLIFSTPHDFCVLQMCCCLEGGCVWGLCC